jgi:hypothetical protein
MFYLDYPNIHQFINILLNVQCETYIKIRIVQIINTKNDIKENEIGDQCAVAIKRNN